MPQPWSKKENRLLTILRPVFTLKEIKRTFDELDIDRSEEAIARRARRMRVKFIDLGYPNETNLEKDECKAVSEVLQLRNYRLKTVEPGLSLSPAEKTKQTNLKKSILDNILGKIRTERKETPRKQSVDLFVPKGEKESLCILLSDFHMGREVINTATQEVEYNLEIGEERILQTTDLILDNLPGSSLKNYDEAVVILAGDHIDGENIYRGQAYEIEQHVVEQLGKTTSATWSTITSLSKIFPLVRIITTRGNHGRTEGAPEANWDNVLFRQLELLVDASSNKNISIKNRYGEFNTMNVKGYKGLVRHRAPVQADTPSAKSRFGNWFAIHEWDFFCYAHWHHWGVMTWQGRPIFRNGSIIGGDPFAETLGAYDPPTQLMWGIAEGRLPTMIVPLLY